MFYKSTHSPQQPDTVWPYKIAVYFQKWYLVAPELNTLSETALADAFQFQLNHLAFVMRHGNRSSDSADDTTYTSIKLCANNACGYFANTCEQAWRFGSHWRSPYKYFFTFIAKASRENIWHLWATWWAHEKRYRSSLGAAKRQHRETLNCVLLIMWNVFSPSYWEPLKAAKAGKPGLHMEPECLEIPDAFPTRDFWLNSTSCERLIACALPSVHHLLLTSSQGTENLPAEHCSSWTLLQPMSALLNTGSHT